MNRSAGQIAILRRGILQRHTMSDRSKFTSKGKAEGVGGCNRLHGRNWSGGGDEENQYHPGKGVLLILFISRVKRATDINDSSNLFECAYERRCPDYAFCGDNGRLITEVDDDF